MHEQMIPVRVTYDEDANAAYIYLADPLSGVAETVPVDPLAVRGMINLDLDAEDRLIGVEILDARERLPRELLQSAKRVD